MSNSNSLTESPSQTFRIEKLVYGGAVSRAHEAVFTCSPRWCPAISSKLAPERASRTSSTRESIKSSKLPRPRGAPLPSLEKCGGCQYQQLSYEQQLHWKREILRELFDRAKLKLDREIQTFATSHSAIAIAPSFTSMTARWGFLEVASHKLVPVDQCPVSSPKINEVLGVLNLIAKDHRFPNS